MTCPGLNKTVTSGQVQLTVGACAAGCLQRMRAGKTDRQRGACGELTTARTACA